MLVVVGGPTPLSELHRRKTTMGIEKGSATVAAQKGNFSLTALMRWKNKYEEMRFEKYLDIVRIARSLALFTKY
jgi:hypothetical protein